MKLLPTYKHKTGSTYCMFYTLDTYFYIGNRYHTLKRHLGVLNDQGDTIITKEDSFYERRTKCS